MTLITRFMLIAGLISFFSVTTTTYAQHLWRPPFGLDRVGSVKQASGIDAEAVARPVELQNPVDLGTILVPHDWLALTQKQSTEVNVVAVSYGKDQLDAHVRIRFASQPEKVYSKPMPLVSDQRSACTQTLDFVPSGIDRDKLLISLEQAEGKVLWEKSITVMLVQTSPTWPQFGAVSTKLRYDLPISVRQDNGQFTTLDYQKGWDPALNDVVVCLPGGGRFVFWRGACYIPFWAGLHNTGLSYEWAETKPPADGFKDCVEPLMDKELRYSRVEILESSATRIHVRWTYQSCDFNYKVWGDAATEDFYFYPDGFGTRVLTLQSTLDSDYELSEFIILTPPGAYPFSVLPKNIVDILFLDGEKREIEFPHDPVRHAAQLKSREMTAVYRVHPHKDDQASAVYYHPTERKLPPVVFGGFLDQGQQVTPCYWGSHWPLGRGQTTGGVIDNRIQLTPSHNSLMSWASQQPDPLRESRLTTLDTLGRSKPMRRQTWAWLIGMTSVSDARLLEWAKSFSQPPSVELLGARLAEESFVLERRAIRLVAGAANLSIKMSPSPICVNPVFEIENATSDLVELTLGGVVVADRDWSWDGKTLWIQTTIEKPTTLQVKFGAASPTKR